MSRKQKAIANFLPAVFGNWSKFMKTLMSFSEQSYADKKAAQLGLTKGLPTIDILDLIPDLNETISSFSFLDDTSRVIDIALIKGLARKFDNKCDYLEIGSWRGESLINIAPLCADVVSLSLSVEEMNSMGFNPRMGMMDGYFIKNTPGIRRIGHNSLTFDFSSLGKKFDLIFVDGDHAYDSVKSDTANAFKMLKDDSSIIVFHDCGMRYEDQRNEVIAAIFEGIPADQRKHLYRVSNTLCGVFIKGDFPTSYPPLVPEPSKIFEVSIKAQKLVR